MAREGFVVYHEMLSWLEPYGDAERGRLLTAMLEYSMTGAVPDLRGNEKYIWPALRDKIDRDREAYEETCRKNRSNISKRWDTTVQGGIQPNTTVYEEVPNVPTETETETETKTKTETEKRESAHPRSEFGWVKLTDTQYAKLQKDLGQEELDRCIRYVDELAQQTGNKNKWKDWNLTIRKCSRDGWGKKTFRSPSKITTAEEYNSRPREVVRLPDDPYGIMDKILAE